MSPSIPRNYIIMKGFSLEQTFMYSFDTLYNIQYHGNNNICIIFLYCYGYNFTV